MCYYQYNLYMDHLCMFIRYLESITQVLKNTSFGLDNWCECGNLFIYYLSINSSINHQSSPVWCPAQNKRIAPLSFFHGCRKRQLKD
jgi:hypothetical protein